MGLYQYRYRVLQTQAAGRTAYGLCAEERQGGQWHLLAEIPDISSRKTLVTQLAERCTRLQLHPIHLLDVILDTIP